MARDNFNQNTIKRLASRAGYTCSICDKLTVGPSDESAEAVNLTGVAAHISGASEGRGSRRYREMPSEDRKDISNGIWLCETHADLIDGDEITFTENILHEIKKKHEEKIKYRHSGINVENGIFTEIEISNLATFQKNTKLNFHQYNLILGQGSPGKTILCEFLASLKYPNLLKRWEDSKNDGNSFFNIKYYRTEELHYTVKIDSKKQISYEFNGINTPILIAPTNIIFLYNSYDTFTRDNSLECKIKESFSSYFGLRDNEFLNFISCIHTKPKYFIFDFIYYEDDDYLTVKLDENRDFKSLNSLSSGERQTFILEIALQLAVFYCKFSSTTIIIDQHAFPSLDSKRYSKLVETVVKNQFKFQFILNTFFEKKHFPIQNVNIIDLEVINN